MLYVAMAYPSFPHLSITPCLIFWGNLSNIKKIKGTFKGSLSLERTYMISPFSPKAFIAGPS